ncbi:arginine biosynthesis bifunctional protein [Lophiotrema nucula]|uniref:Arginine biosynthesis bifunctional protein ArgJ, mitochondrial n=1 Tax=Lophiotrema nucula TaxID=690887 RepID=A0A6A5YX79_9PLEO|nr:arginine biosynthesis bifunctional protein [Lophiotrema nucula]
MFSRVSTWLRHKPLRLSHFRSYSAPASRSDPPAKLKFIPSSGTYPKGFFTGSSHAGVKATNTRYNDIALVVSEQPCSAAALFTRNVFKAAPVHVSQTILQRRRDGFHGVVVNSGNANAVTGLEGSKHASKMASTADQCLAASFSDSIATSALPETPRMLVMSTGVIGQRLPIDPITAAIPEAYRSLGATHADWMSAARAICTTDTFPKLLSQAFTLPSNPAVEYRIAGMTKGAGMLHPNMGTLLAIICTDAKIDPASITQFLKCATDVTFNCISVDGDTSTNDTIALFANGAAAPAGADALAIPKDVSDLTSIDSTLTEDTRTFARVLTKFLTDLSHLVVRDGEGATKFITIRVQSATSIQAARRAASSISTSALVKTAFYGKDANWGRILCAIGYAPGIVDNPILEIPAGQADQVKPSETSVTLIPADASDELCLLKRGEPQDVDEGRAKQILQMEDVEILVQLNDADGAKSGSQYEATYWTCDLSHEYVTINADYRT